MDNNVRYIEKNGNEAESDTIMAHKIPSVKYISGQITNKTKTLVKRIYTYTLPNINYSVWVTQRSHI